MKAEKTGCGRFGRDKNSGLNITPSIMDVHLIQSTQDISRLLKSRDSAILLFSKMS
jgi:hypothetical protein